MQPDSIPLSRAVVVFLGFGRAAWPRTHRGGLVEEFGLAQGRALEARVLALLDELGRIQTDWSTHSLQSAGEVARAEMHKRHPELSEEALRALEWKFTYDWR